MSSPIRELPGHAALKAIRRLEWRYQTLNDDYEAAMSIQQPELELHERTFQYSRRDQLYEAERLLHHYFSGYYTYWRQVMTVGHSVGDPECKGRIERLRNQHDDKPGARITRGLRVYVQKENVLPLMVYQSDHDDTAPKYAVSKADIRRDGLYDPSFNHYFGSVDGTCIFPYEVIEANWNLVESLHESVKELVKIQMEVELEEYQSRLEDLEEAAEDVPLTDLMEQILPSEDPLPDVFFQD